MCRFTGSLQRDWRAELRLQCVCPPAGERGGHDGPQPGGAGGHAAQHPAGRERQRGGGPAGGPLPASGAGETSFLLDRVNP